MCKKGRYVFPCDTHILIGCRAWGWGHRSHPSWAPQCCLAWLLHVELTNSAWGLFLICFVSFSCLLCNILCFCFSPSTPYSWLLFCLLLQRLHGLIVIDSSFLFSPHRLIFVFVFFGLHQDGNHGGGIQTPGGGILASMTHWDTIRTPSTHHCGDIRSHHTG